MQLAVMILGLMFAAIIGSIIYFNSSFFHAVRLVRAIKSDDMEEVQRIVEKDPASINRYPTVAPPFWQSAMNRKDMYPLTQACHQGNEEMIRFLIASGADVNCNDGYTPLSVTYRRKNDNWYAVSLLLLQNGADLHYKTEYSGGMESALFDIIQPRPLGNSTVYVPESNEEVFNSFLFAVENCSRDEVNWDRLFRRCVSCGYERRGQEIEYLLNGGFCSVNTPDEEGKTPLMYAAERTNVQTVDYLILNGAKIDAMDNTGKTVLDYAKSEDIRAVIAEKIKFK